MVIEDLYDMHTPAWLLNIVASYLSDRSMVLTFNNSESSRKMLPGGGPQGAYLGGIVFIIKYNGAFLRPPIPRPIPGPIMKSKVGHILPPENNLLQFYIEDTENFASENKMVINKKKTKVISFNKSRKWDFPPELKFSDGAPIEYVPDTKLVGVILSENLSWSKNTSYICDKARQKIWMLRRMLKLDMDIFTLFDVYTKEVRSILEMAVPVWHSGLTKLQTLDIERIQKVSFRIILGNQYVSYRQACDYFATEALEDRRVKLCRKFAKKNFKSENCMFTKSVKTVNTRQKGNLVKEYKCRTKRYQKSSLPYLAKLLNTKQK